MITYENNPETAQSTTNLVKTKVKRTDLVRSFLKTSIIDR